MPRKSDPLAEVRHINTEKNSDTNVREPERKKQKTSRVTRQTTTKSYLASQVESTRHVKGGKSGGDLIKRKAPATKAKPKWQQPGTQSIQDPFERLGIDVLGLIISYLPAPETETLRRVSKLWKFASETHNTGGALQRHFGHVGEKMREYRNRQTANLEFRRRLYHEKSLENGMVTKMFSYRKVVCWRICNHRLLRASARSVIYICDLRSRDVDKGIKEIDLSTMLDGNIALMDAQLTHSGDVVATVMAEEYESVAADLRETQAEAPTNTEDGNLGAAVREDRLRSKKTTTIYLIKVSFDGTIVWKVEQLAWALYRRTCFFGGRMSTKHHFSFENLEDSNGAILAGVFAFTIRDLEDGQIVKQQRLPSPLTKLILDSGPATIPLNSRSATSNDRDMVVVLDGSRNIFIFDAFTGKYISCLPWFYRTVVLSTAPQDIRALYYENGKICTEWLRSTYNPVTRSLAHSKLRLYAQSPRLQSDIGIDFDRSLLFRLLHSGQAPRRGAGGVDDSTTWVVSNLKHGPGRQRSSMLPFGALREPSSGLMITLPPEPLKKNIFARGGEASNEKEQKAPATPRRVLELETPWEEHPDNFVGMVGDYLVYYMVMTQTLVVVDFWPQW